MSVLDAQALIAFLTDEPARPDVEALLRDATDPACIGAVNLAECADILVRVKGVPWDVAGRALDLALESLEVIAVDGALARRAGELRARHYDRARRPVSLSDCLALATALGSGQRLATGSPLATGTRLATALGSGQWLATGAPLATGARLATSDPDLAAMAREEGCAVVPLPDQKGRRPV